jgi:hypothetical protein
MSTASADIIIYGGMSAAVIAAVQAARMKKSVIVVSPDSRIGGLSTGGLGFTDSGNTEAIGGLAREFYERLYVYYSDDANWKWETPGDFCNIGQGTPAIDHEANACWCFEPRAALAVFEEFISEYDIDVRRDEWLNRETGVDLVDGVIRSISTHSGSTYSGKMFIDATYEGDLLAAAGAGYHVGREANSVYDEEWNGVQVGTLHHKHWFFHDVSPYVTALDSDSGLLPHVSVDDPGTKGEGDAKVQAYCFRMCLSNHPDNRIPFPKPDGYDSAEYALFPRAWAEARGEQDFFEKYDVIPNRKTDTNNHGPFSTDYIGMNWDYPEASYEERCDIIADHERYQKGLMYFAQNDPSVPAYIRDGLKEWGLPRDEYEETSNWSPQLYIREARRLVGKRVMTEHEVMGRCSVDQSIGMGSYALDSHNIQRYITPEGSVQNEGDIGVHPKQAYGIDYHCIVPKDDEIGNLLVPVCLSSSHIAFGSIRMEPVFMVLGHSAAAAAALAIDAGSSVQELDYAKLRETLLEEGQILEV